MKRNANKLVKYSKNHLQSTTIKWEYRTNPKHFTKESPLDFETTSMIILNMVKKSLKAELMNYFYKLDKELKIPSRQAFSEAREKIDYRLFKDFFEKSCELATTEQEVRLYKGYRLYATDGTSFTVGDLSKLSDYFGESTTVKGKAMCRINAVVDVLNECIVNALVSPFETGERALAIIQTEELKTVSNALYLFDRGYWSSELVSKIIENGQKFLMRLSSNHKNAVAHGVNGDEYDLRRYTFILPSGEKEILLTNIPEHEMSDDELAALYAKRWGVETKYLELKARLQIDSFSGKSVNIVLQDIYSTLYISNLVAFICYEADEEIAEKTEGNNNKYKQKANRSFCISALRCQFIDICLLDNPFQIDSAFQRLVDTISKEVIYIDKSKPKPRNSRQLKDSRRHKFNSLL